MKNLFLATCMAAGVSSTPVAAAGPGERQYSPATVTRATTLTRALAQRIHINEGQYIAIKQLHMRMLSERTELESSLAGASPAERDTQLAAAQFRYENELSNLLRPDQRVAYQRLRSNFTAHRLR